MKLKDFGSNKKQIGYYDKIVGTNDNIGLFFFASCAPIEKYNQSYNRCDQGALGPVCIHWDDRFPYVLPYPLKNLSNLKYVVPIIDFAPDFYIMYWEIQELEVEALTRNYTTLPDWQKNALDNGWVPKDKWVDSEYYENYLIESTPCRFARTLGELFKLIIEWDYVVDPPFSSTEIAATLSRTILEKLQMPADVKTEIESNVPDMHVAMYLQGNLNASQRPSGVPNITPLFEEWILQKLLDYQYRGPIVS